MQGAGRHDGAHRPEATQQAFARHTPWPRLKAVDAVVNSLQQSGMLRVNRDKCLF